MNDQIKRRVLNEIYKLRAKNLAAVSIAALARRIKAPYHPVWQTVNYLRYHGFVTCTRTESGAISVM